MRQTLRVAALAILMAGALAACQPTGDDRCHDPLAPLVYITEAGYTLDCTPPFDGTNDGTQQNPKGWTSHSDKTVYVWPDEIRTRRLLTKVLFHEAGHAQGWRNEWDADHWAFCHMTPAQRDGIGFLTPMPQQSDCWRYL